MTDTAIGLVSYQLLRLVIMTGFRQPAIVHTVVIPCLGVPHLGAIQIPCCEI